MCEFFTPIVMLVMHVNPHYDVCMRSTSKQDLPYAATEAAEALGRVVSIGRRQRLWTQADLAAKAEMSLGTLTAIEKGSTTVQLGYWLKALWAVDQAERITRLAAPDVDPLGVELMVDRLPKRVKHSRHSK